MGKGKGKNKKRKVQRTNTTGAAPVNLHEILQKQGIAVDPDTSEQELVHTAGTRLEQAMKRIMAPPEPILKRLDRMGVRYWLEEHDGGAEKILCVDWNELCTKEYEFLASGGETALGDIYGKSDAKDSEERGGESGEPELAPDQGLTTLRRPGNVSGADDDDADAESDSAPC